MKLTTGLMLVVTVIVFSVVLAIISDIVSVESTSVSNSQNFEQKTVKIDDSSKRLLWFMQISDIHVSIYHDPYRASDLKEFCEETVAVVKPSVVIASGDLTDAKHKDSVGSTQFLGEWKLYQGALVGCPALKNTVWLDVRGNHDNFDVPGRLSHRNYFRNYSIQGSKHGRSYSHQVKYGDESVTFLALDACPEQGLRRPFNFFGLLQKTELDHIDQLISKTKSNYIIWFGHFPTSCLLTHGSGARKVIGSDPRSIAYLCGHLHTLAGFVPNMYTVQKQGFYELELGDWKDNRMYRIAALDHGYFSFIDVQHREWPVALVTWPKSAQFLSLREPSVLNTMSSHIRLLVFSLSPILTVRIKIDSGPWENCLHKNGPLFVLPWNSKLYSKDLHHMEVYVLDEGGREKTFHHSFSLDRTRVSFGFLGRLALMSNLSILSQILFGLAIAACVIPLCFLRFWNQQVLMGKSKLPRVRPRFLQNWLRRIWILANINRLFYPLIFYPLYLTIGPWSFGELIEGHLGVIFSWGIFVNQSYIPGAFTYSYGFLQLVLFQWPCIFTLAHKIDGRVNQEANSPWRLVSFFCDVSNIAMCFLAATQITLAYGFWLAYGTMALLFGPFRLFPMVFVVWGWRQTATISDKKIRMASYVWNKR